MEITFFDFVRYIASWRGWRTYINNLQNIKGGTRRKDGQKKAVFSLGFTPVSEYKKRSTQKEVCEEFCTCTVGVCANKKNSNHRRMKCHQHQGLSLRPRPNRKTTSTERNRWLSRWQLLFLLSPQPRRGTGKHLRCATILWSSILRGEAEMPQVDTSRSVPFHAS